MSRINPSTMKGPGDFDLPDEGPECPECDEPMEVQGSSAECMSCGHVEESGPEEPDDCDAEYDDCDRSEAVHWGGMDG
jgi:hypothetical protein